MFVFSLLPTIKLYYFYNHKLSFTLFKRLINNAPSGELHSSGGGERQVNKGLEKSMAEWERGRSQVRMEKEEPQGGTLGGRAAGFRFCEEEMLQLGLGALRDPQPACHSK